MSAGIKANTDGLSGAIQVNGTDVVTVTSAGNVGVGTTSVAHAGTGTTSLNLHATSSAPFLKLSNNGTGNTLADGFDLAIDQSGSVYVWNRENANIQFATNNVARSVINADGSQQSVIPGGSVLYPEFKCRAWVNFNGTGTVAVRKHGNVSSVTDLGVGYYQINLATALPDTDFALHATCTDDNVNSRTAYENGTFGQQRTVSSARIYCVSTSGTISAVDATGVYVSLFR